MVNINPDFLEESWGVGASPKSHTVVGLSVATAVPDALATVIVPWNLIALESGEKNFFDIANPTIFTIPAGVIRVRIASQLHLIGSSGSAYIRVLLLRNGSSALGWGGQKIVSVAIRSSLIANVEGQIITPPFEVAAGDTLSLQVSHTGTAGNLQPGSWFSIEDMS